MPNFLTTVLVLFSFFSCQSQPTSPPEMDSGPTTKDQVVGGRCEGCEALFEYGKKKLWHTDTLPTFKDAGPKLKITGTVFQKDGKTPAPGVILYIYHTDREGNYPIAQDAKGWAAKHGSIRGWVMTDETGQYTFFTTRPAAYPDSDIPEHIHSTIKEPGKTAYFIDDFVFDDDPNLTTSRRQGLGNRGGSGIVHPEPEGDYLLVKRDIVLGMNIQGYD